MAIKMNVVGGAVTQGGKLQPYVADKGDPGSPGAASTVPGPEGDDGWSPILAGEADGTRTLIKVVDWTGGQGTKPATGMYIGTTGYVTTKAQAFNFNAAKRVLPFSSGPTNAQGVAAISFASAGFTSPPVVVPLKATTSVLSGDTSTVITNVTKDGCTATVRGATLLTGVVGFLVGAVANVLAIEQ